MDQVEEVPAYTQTIGVFIVIADCDWKRVESALSQSSVLQIQERVIKINSTHKHFDNAKVYYCISAQNGSFHGGSVNIVLICGDSLLTCIYIHSALKRERRATPEEELASNPLAERVPRDIDVDGIILLLNSISDKEVSKVKYAVSQHFTPYLKACSCHYIGVALEKDWRGAAFPSLEHFYTFNVGCHKLVQTVLTFRNCNKIPAVQAEEAKRTARKYSVHEYETLDRKKRMQEVTAAASGDSSSAVSAPSRASGAPSTVVSSSVGWAPSSVVSSGRAPSSAISGGVAPSAGSFDSFKINSNHTLSSNSVKTNDSAKSKTSTASQTEITFVRKTDSPEPTEPTIEEAGDATDRPPPVPPKTYPRPGARNKDLSKRNSGTQAIFNFDPSDYAHVREANPPLPAERVPDENVYSNGVVEELRKMSREPSLSEQPVECAAEDAPIRSKEGSSLRLAKISLDSSLDRSGGSHLSLKFNRTVNLPINKSDLFLPYQPSQTDESCADGSDSLASSSLDMSTAQEVVASFPATKPRLHSATLATPHRRAKKRTEDIEILPNRSLNHFEMSHILPWRPTAKPDDNRRMMSSQSASNLPLTVHKLSVNDIKRSLTRETFPAVFTQGSQPDVSYDQVPHEFQPSTLPSRRPVPSTDTPHVAMTLPKPNRQLVMPRKEENPPPENDYEVIPNFEQSKSFRDSFGSFERVMKPKAAHSYAQNIKYAQVRTEEPYPMMDGEYDSPTPSEKRPSVAVEKTSKPEKRDSLSPNDAVVGVRRHSLATPTPSKNSSPTRSRRGSSSSSSSNSNPEDPAKFGRNRVRDRSPFDALCSPTGVDPKHNRKLSSAFIGAKASAHTKPKNSAEASKRPGEKTKDRAKKKNLRKDKKIKALFL